MTHQLLPRHGHAPDADDCHALALYWDNEAMRPDANICSRVPRRSEALARTLAKRDRATHTSHAQGGSGLSQGALADRADARSRRKRPGFFS